MSNLDYAAKQLNKIRNRINDAAQAVGRDADSIRLIGASKVQPPELIADFATKGLRDIGENYLQEAIDKKAQLSRQDLQWHFIGHIQSNKTKLIAQNFDWVHGVDRLKIAARLGQHSLPAEPVNILVQINLDAEQSKSGVVPSEVAELCDQISQLSNVSLRGFMTIPKPRKDFDAQKAAFQTAQELMLSTNQRYGLSLDQLSMGMSNDLEAAIAAGSTMIRVGTALFGARASQHQ
ncbi:MAG: pyridoxal phosphate enzyme (YggS family) [Cryomorphaceae bacterium]|jgi:pyridoxal phosphate enzyme (YggS family)